MLWILAAMIGCYAVFVFAPAVVAVCTIFRAKPGDSFDALLAPGAQFAPYAERMRAAKARFDAFPKQRISIAACDGVVLSADYCDRKSAKTAILMHGYRTDPMVNFAMQADMFLRHGYNVLLIRQRGHEAGGKARCGLGLLERYDAIAWNEHALSTEGVEETVLYGVSMGAAAVGFAACDLDPEKTRADPRLRIPLALRADPSRLQAAERARFFADAADPAACEAVFEVRHPRPHGRCAEEHGDPLLLPARNKGLDRAV